MPIVRRSRRLSTQTLPDHPLDQHAPGSFDYLDIPYSAPEPPVEYPAVTTVADGDKQLLSPRTIEVLTAFADQRELPTPDLHFECRGRRKGKNGNAPRPSNAFMLFRSDFWKYNKGSIAERNHRQISCMAAVCWRALDDARKVPYQDQARRLKDEHAQMYPQHKYNVSAKERATIKVKKEIDNDELCSVVAARVVQDFRDSMSPTTSGSSESGLLDRIAERKAKVKRPRSAPAAAVVEGATHVLSQHSRTPIKKHKQGPRKITVVPVPVVRPDAGPSRSPGSPFIPTNQIPALALSPFPNCPAVETEWPQHLVLEAVAQVVADEKEPTLSPPATPEEAGTPDFEVPEKPASVSPHFPSFDHEAPVEWHPLPADAVIDMGLQISDDYGLSRPTEEFDFSAFGYIDNEPSEFESEFAQWINI